MVTRAAVRSITGLTGTNPPPSCDRIDLRVDQRSFHVGSSVTGTVQLHHDELRSSSSVPNNKSVYLVLEGVESTVVAFPQTSDNSMGMDYLKKHTTEQHILTRQELTLEYCSKPQIFRFALADNLPSTLRCVLDGTDPTLPSQCNIKYTVTASIYNNNSSKLRVKHPITVFPKKESTIPLDPVISVSVGSSLDVLCNSFFSCGGLFNVDEPMIANDNDNSNNYILLESSHDHNLLHLSAGQVLKVDVVKDWLGHLSRRATTTTVWMMRVSEELTWKAQGRTAHNRETWELFANHHELPTTLRPTYNHDTTHHNHNDRNAHAHAHAHAHGSLIQVKHELVVYLTTKKNGAKEILATTEPIPIQIVTSNRGWDA
jgi:hypothetical protein